MGDVELHITGPDHDVFVTVTNVQSGQTIIVSITLNGDVGSLQVESRQGGNSEHKVEVCHVTGDGSYQLLEVDEEALADHEAHGDGLPGEVVPTDPDAELMFDDNCGIPAGEEEEEEEEDEEEEEEEDEEPSEGAEKVELCHLTGNGGFRHIEVSVNAVPAHMAHGDGEPLGIVPNSELEVSFGENCSIPVVAPA